jgi:hypothetical protein
LRGIIELCQSINHSLLRGVGPHHLICAHEVLLTGAQYRGRCARECPCLSSCKPFPLWRSRHWGHF